MNVKPFPDILLSLKHQVFPQDLDLVIGVARGGIVPSYIISKYLNLPLEIIWIHFRNEEKKPEADCPFLTKDISFSVSGKNVLIVDDRSNTGATLRFAAGLFPEAASVSTCVINGPADISLFNQECFAMPWDIEQSKHTSSNTPNTG